MTFDVLPPANDVKRTTISSLKANGGKLTLSRDLVADLIASRTKINLSVGPTARLDVPGLLAQLDRYPYGCAEQTVRAHCRCSTLTRSQPRSASRKTRR